MRVRYHVFVVRTTVESGCGLEREVDDSQRDEEIFFLVTALLTSHEKPKVPPSIAREKTNEPAIILGRKRDMSSLIDKRRLTARNLAFL